MKLSELTPQMRIPGRVRGNWWNRYWHPDTYKKHARKAWKGAAHVEGVEYVGLMLFTKDGTCGPYALSFEDAMANDWELVNES